MREIKFRAWDKHNKTWITDPVGFTMSVVDGKFHVFGFDDAFADMYQIRVELQQYTGLKDKNGVEIYEGDIVHYTDLSAYDADHTEQVHFENGVFRFGTLGASRASEWEVIGNVHESPELLK